MRVQECVVAHALFLSSCINIATAIQHVSRAMHVLCALAVVMLVRFACLLNFFAILLIVCWACVDSHFSPLSSCASLISSSSLAARRK